MGSFRFRSWRDNELTNRDLQRLSEYGDLREKLRKKYGRSIPTAVPFYIPADGSVRQGFVVIQNVVCRPEVARNSHGNPIIFSPELQQELRWDDFYDVCDHWSIPVEKPDPADTEVSQAEDA